MAEQLKKEELRDLYNARFDMFKKGGGVKKMYGRFYIVFFQKYVDKNAIDMNPDVRESALPGIKL